MTHVADRQVRRIVHAVAPAALGGAEEVILMSLTAIRESGGSAELFAMLRDKDTEKRKHPFLDRARQTARVRTYRSRRRRYRAEVGSLATILSERSETLLHTHGYHANVVGTLAAGRAGVPHVITVHGPPLSYTLRSLAYHTLDRWAIRRADLVIAVSKDETARLQSKIGRDDRVRFLANAFRAGVSPFDRDTARQRLGLSKEKLALGWIGRMAVEKGCDILIRALSRVHKDVHLALVGDGPLRGRWEREAAREGILDRVRFVGAIERASRFIPAFDIFVLPSRAEGSPITVLEAMHARVPVVAAFVGGVPEILDHGRCGMLVPSESVEGLADAIQRLAGDVNLRKELADRAYSRVVSRYSFAEWSNRLWQLYREAPALADLRERMG